MLLYIKDVCISGSAILRGLELLPSGNKGLLTVCAWVLSVCVLIRLERARMKYIYGQIFTHLVIWEIGLSKSQIVQ